MNSSVINENRLTAFREALRKEERSPGTIENYLRTIRAFAKWLSGENMPLDKEAAVAWKEHLIRAGYGSRTVNTMLAALNKFFAFLGRADCCMKYLRIQRTLFRPEHRELSREEYQRLILAAREVGQQRLALLIESICATGIRVSEVKYLTVEAARRGRADVALKGKIRTIFIPGKLCKKLLNYAKKQKCASGEIFLTRSGRSLSRKQIWAEMKALCGRAGVAGTKVFPHNLRHLFARCFYRVCQDIVKLADILGHSSIETTRIYLLSTGREHTLALDRMRLILS